MMTKGLNVIPTSSVGRLFDGVAALIGLRSHVSFEGQAAMELEAIANREVNVVLPLPVVAVNRGDALILDTRELIRGIVAGMTSGQSREALSSAFHGALAAACAETAILIRQTRGAQRVVLSGGCFQNRLLLEGCVKAMEKAHFEVFFHQRVPTNDGGISLGQAVCAGAILKNRGKRYET
jgi:hydrogenase maturation protein HypF